MEVALKVFANGIAGVFLGMAALYLAMKLVSHISARFPEKEKS